MAAAPRGVRVWDAVVRLAHWSLAALVVFNLVRDDGDYLHRVVGYVAAGIVAARWLWGLLLARGYSRLAALKPSPRATLRYLQAHLHGNAARHIGHNPLGLWMVWLMWLLVLLLALTGWISRLDAFWGDERVHDLHAWLAYALMAAVALHLAGVAFMSWCGRENLPLAMITGRKRELDS
jgi:cytochrome b